MNRRNSTSQLIAEIRARLELAFSPTVLELKDESHHHVGHAGAADGKSHLRLKISSQAFDSMTLISAHRRIYEVLGDLMQTSIHALIIQVVR